MYSKSGLPHFLWITFVPLVFVAIKWIVIGRYKAGRYPIRGSYYLRWWFVDVCRKLFLRGIWGSDPRLLRFYYRMLGADIGSGARISLECDFAEYDLIQVGRKAAIDLCTLRAFAVDNGAMILGPVRVGNESSVGLRSVVAPFTQIPDYKHLGPVTSSYDATPGTWSEQQARVNRQFFQKPSKLLERLIGVPILFLVNAFSQLPPIGILYALLWYKSREEAEGEHFFDSWNEVISWLCDPRRIPFFIGIFLARAFFTPFFYMFAAIIVKKVIIGKFEAGPRSNSDWERLRYWLAAALFPRKRLQKCTELMGRHYEGVSVLYRLLGSKVGKRVFWPGSQPVTDGTFDLLEIGDDAVFGSRSALICTTVDHAEKIIICAGGNVSDNCVVMAGSVIGKNAVLGSNSICPEGTYLPSGSVWFGSNGSRPTCLNPGDNSDAEYYQPLNEECSTDGVPQHASNTVDPRALVMDGDDSTLRPFGKAFYKGDATYSVLSLKSIVLFTIANRTFQVLFHLLPLWLAIQLGAVVLYTDHFFKEAWRNSFFFTVKEFDGYADDEGVTHDQFLWWTRVYDNQGHWHSFIQVYCAVVMCFILTHALRVLFWLVIELSAKWLYMGRRKPGRYNYDTSDYAQRWELYQLTAKIRKLSRLNLLQFITGTPMMNLYIRLNGGDVGKDCCLYPSGADPFMPEPDLVKIGDGCAVDCASIVCHLNTRGNFELAKITIEDKCTLRTRSRLQQGVVMETGSQLLEKSLAMTGEIIGARSVWQGGPASSWFRYKAEEVADYQPPSVTKTKTEVEMKNMVD